MRGGGLGGTAAIVAASALLAASLAGGPLYVSSSASQALQLGMASTCATDTGLLLNVPGVPPVGDSALVDELDAAAASVPYSAAPRLTRGTLSTYTVAGSDAPAEQIVLISRDGQLANVDAGVGALGDGQVVVPVSAEARNGVGMGTTIDVVVPAQRPGFTPDVRSVQGGVDGSYDITYADGTTRHFPPPPPLSLKVVGTFADIPIQPEPSFWCGLRQELRPNAQGDPPPVMVLVDASVLTRFGAEFGTQWELRPSRDTLTVHQGKQLLAGLRHVQAVFAAATGADQQPAAGQRQLVQQDPQLVRLIRQAEQVGAVVDRTMAPIRLAGTAAGALLLGGGAVLVARERRRELRLRLLRGEAPWSLGWRVAAAEAVPIVVGTVVGAALALAAVVTLGPTPELEPGALWAAGLAALAGGLGAVALVGVVAAWSASRTVDAGRRRRVRWVPWELLAVVPVVLAGMRLDRLGGVRLVGETAIGGDLVAQAFALLALVAVPIVLVRPLMWLARRSRRWGRRLPVALLTGLRRVGAEPGISVVVAGATAVALGALVVSTAMTDSAHQLLADKAAVFVGGDEAISVTEYLDLPAPLVGTVVGRLDARDTARQSVTVLGVDPSTFAEAVRWRDDAAGASLADLLASIDDPPADGPIPAIVVGSPAPGSLDTLTLQTLDVREVGRARWFPGEHSGAALVVVDRDALVARKLGVAEQVWLRDPPDDAVTLLREAGFHVGATQRAREVFDVIGFLAVRWSYAALAAFGVLIGVVVVLAQLLVLDARRRARQANDVLSRPMGRTARGLAGAIFTELAIPFVVGVVLGLASAVVVLRIAVPRLDTLRNLPPPARVVLDLPAIGWALLVGVVVLVALAGLATRGVRRADPMEVMRGGA